MLAQTTELFDYQLDAVRLLKHIQRGDVGYQRQGALLALGPGFGKTLISLLAARRVVEEAAGYDEERLPIIVVTEVSPVQDWMAACAKHFSPPLEIEYLGSKAKRSQAATLKNWHTLRRFDVLVTNYEMLVQFHALASEGDTLSGSTEGSKVVYAREWPVVIFDEVHKIRNSTTSVFDAVQAVRSSFKLGITATPCNNSIEDVVSVFNGLGILPENASEWSTSDGGFLRDFQRARQCYVIRGADYSHERSHYRPTDIVLRMPLEHDTERRVYAEAERDHNIASIMQTRQICSGSVGEGACTKVQMLVAYLKNVVVSRREKALVLCEFRESVTKIHAHVQEHFGREVRVFKADGQTSQAERTKIRAAFENAFGAAVLVVTGIFNQGVNLECANHVVHFDIWWNPVVADQGRSRIERPGQRRSVFNVQLLIEKSIEDGVWALAHEKRLLIQRILEGEHSGGKEETTDECLFLARRLERNVSRRDIEPTCHMYFDSVDALKERVPQTQMLVRHASMGGAKAVTTVKRARKHLWEVKVEDMQTTKATMLPKRYRYHGWRQVRRNDIWTPVASEPDMTMAAATSSSSSSPPTSATTRKRTSRCRHVNED